MKLPKKARKTRKLIWEFYEENKFGIKFIFVIATALIASLLTNLYVRILSWISRIGVEYPQTRLYSVPIIIAIISGLMMLVINHLHRKNMSNTIDKRIPPIEYIKERDQIDREIALMALRAEEFIMSTGGKSSNQDYFNNIEKKVSEGIEYERIIFSEDISTSMCRHLCKIFARNKNKITIWEIADKGYSNMLITDNGLIIALPLPEEDNKEEAMKIKEDLKHEDNESDKSELMGIIIPNEDQARDMKEYFKKLTDSNKVPQIEEAEKIRMKCKNHEDCKIESCLEC